MRVIGQCKRVARCASAVCALTVVAVLGAGCFCPGGTVICDSWPFADAWVDADCDGRRDGDEEGLPGVCVWSTFRPYEAPPSLEYCAHDHSTTDGKGSWRGGPVSGCWANYYIVAGAPPGFEPTTDTVVGGSMSADFGFAPEGACPGRSVLTPSDLAARRLARSNLIGIVVLCAPVLLGLILAGVELRARRRARIQMDDQAV